MAYTESCPTLYLMLPIKTKTEGGQCNAIDGPPVILCTGCSILDLMTQVHRSWGVETLPTETLLPLNPMLCRKLCITPSYFLPVWKRVLPLIRKIDCTLLFAAPPVSQS